jgi:hypothetical protein
VRRFARLDDQERIRDARSSTRGADACASRTNRRAALPPTADLRDGLDDP